MGRTMTRGTICPACRHKCRGCTRAATIKCHCGASFRGVDNPFDPPPVRYVTSKKRSVRNSGLAQRFLDRYPSLGLDRGCGTCNRILADLDDTTDVSMLKGIAKRIVHNSQIKGLHQFGLDRKEQIKQVETALLQLSDPRNLRTTCDRDDVTIATVHYNPCGYRRLRETYYEWLPTLGPMAKHVQCHELVFDDDNPEIEGSIVIRGTRDANAMWQKEPMLNLALAACETPYFAWVDHDIISHSATWLSDAIDMIGDCYHAVQLFDRLRKLGRSGTVSHTVSGSQSGGTNPGGAWIADTQWLQSVGGFPTRWIVGAGDAEWHMQHQHAATHLPATAYHLWHGDKSGRQHSTRQSILKRHKFDHRHDTKINADGILEWASKKPNLHREVRQFFERRREDG